MYAADCALTSSLAAFALRPDLHLDRRRRQGGASAPRQHAAGTFTIRAEQGKAARGQQQQQQQRSQLDETRVAAECSMRRRQLLGLVPGGLALAAAQPAFADAQVRHLDVCGVKELGLERRVDTFDYSWVTENFAAGTEFSLSAYEAMRDDVARTPAFEEALRRRIRGNEGNVTVVDIGTGPFAVLAIAAAKAGARKVYAIEADPKAAKLARKAILQAGYETRIQVVEGYSTQVQLLEKVDVCVAEVIGSVATEEGVYRTIRDAQQRFVKEPADPKNWIPLRVQTMIAPAAYAFHYMIAAEGRKAAGLTSEEGPLRLNCIDQSLVLMDDPQVLEDFRYNDLALPGDGVWTPPAPLAFKMSGPRLAENTRQYVNTLGFDGMNPKDAKLVSEGVARGFSGLAMWPRLVLDEKEDLVVEARSTARGAPQRSHWQTVLPLMVKVPLTLGVGDAITVTASAQFDSKLPTTYNLSAEVRRA